MIFYYLPFSTKPEYLFVKMKKRLFRHAVALLKAKNSKAKRNWVKKKIETYHKEHLQRTTQKMRLWASKIDTAYFNTTSKEQLMAFSEQCDQYSAKLLLLIEYEQKLEMRPLYTRVKAIGDRKHLAEISAYMIEASTAEELESIFLEEEKVMRRAEEEIEAVKASLNPNDYTMQEVSAFYININLRNSVWIALKKCRDGMLDVDFKSLQMSRF